jgi:hypothetical protein
LLRPALSTCCVQPSTLVRLARHLGYEGFSDLQLVFRDRLRDPHAAPPIALLGGEQRDRIVEDPSTVTSWRCGSSAGDGFDGLGSRSRLPGGS